MVNPPVPDSEARQAVGALAGYAYQLYQTLLAWFALQPGELLFIEIAEDYAVATGNTIHAAQVRATAANITLRSEYVLEALNAYWALRLKNSAQRVTYRYLTTSGIGREQGLAFPDGLTGLQYWRLAAKPGSDVGPVRNALLTLALSNELRVFVESASDDDFRAHLLAAIHWDCGEAALAELKEMTALQSAWRATKVAQATAMEGKALVDPLIARVLAAASQKTTRRLTSVDLDEFIQERLMRQIPLRALRPLLGAGLPSEPTTNLDIMVDAAGVPLPEPLLERPDLIKSLASKTSRGGLLFLQGSSGKGKSTIAKLLARELGSAWAILDFRGLEARDTNSRLALATSTAASAKASLILDDLPVEFDANIEKALAILARTLRLQDKLALVTCSNRPSARMFSLLGAADDLVVETPNLTRNEVSALVQKLGGDGELWGAITHTVGGFGHPQLVMARLRRLSREGWPEPELFTGIDPAKPAGEIDDERAATRRRLYDELDDNARALIDRLSVVGSRFDRKIALAISAEPPPVGSAGDALTQLTGPWIERLERGYLRLSPLLSGSAKDNLTAEQVRRISIRVVNDIMSRNPIEGSLISVAFVHALASKHDAALARLAALPMTMEGDKKRYVAEQLLGLEMLRTDRHIRPENPHVSVLLRQAQFQVCAERSSWELAETVASRLIEEAKALPEHQLRDEMTAISISTVLSEQRLPTNPANWFKYLVNFTELLASAEGELGEEVRKAAEVFRESSGFGLSQLLFALAATRRSSIAELESLFTQLDALQPEVRKDLMSAFVGGPGDINLLVANAWLGDHDRQSLDGVTAAERYEKLARRADAWDVAMLAIQCEIARSVMLDEYALNPQAALEALNDAEKRYGVRPELARQRAKVLHRKGDHKGSLDVMRKIGDQLDPKDYVERAFAYRSAGVSAGELRDWPESIAFFGKAREAALQAKGNLASMAVGLLGDIAASEVRAGDTKSALAHMKQALEEVETFEPPKSDVQLYTRHLLGHVPTWMDQELFPKAGWEGFGALAPGKCSQPDPIPAVLERPVYPLDICWYQLASVERRTDQDVGIRAAIRSWPESRKIVSLEGVISNDDVAYFVRKRSLAEFQEALVDDVSALLEMSRRSAEITAQGLMNAPRGAFPRLTLDALEAGDAPAVVSTAVLGYALSCVIAGDARAYDELIELAGCDLASASSE